MEERDNKQVNQQCNIEHQAVRNTMNRNGGQGTGAVEDGGWELSLQKWQSAKPSQKRWHLSRDLTKAKDEANWISGENIPDRGNSSAKPSGRNEIGIFTGEQGGQYGRIWVNRGRNGGYTITLDQELTAYSLFSTYNTPGRWVGWPGGGRWEGWEEEGRFTHSQIFIYSLFF